MIPKTCPLNDRCKLQTTLQNQCAIKRYSETAENCKGCQYGKESQLELEKNAIKERLTQIRSEYARKMKVEEMKRELLKKRGW